MYKIAYLTFNWSFDLCHAFNCGVRRFLRENKDVRVYMFNGYGKYGQWTPESGNFEIYNLPDFNQYDGFIIQGNRSWPKEMRQETADQIYRLNKPCVSMNYRLQHTLYVGTDNVEAEYTLVRSLLERHVVPSVSFVRGYKHSREAEEREEGFLKAVREYHIEDVRMYDASWNVQEGRAAGERMLKEDRKPARLIVCANDDLAMSIEQLFLEHGIKIPEEVMICGFDNTTMASGMEPRITTVDRDYAGIAYTSMQMLHDVLEGKKTDEENDSPFTIVYGSSTGDQPSDDELLKFKKEYFSLHDELSDYYSDSDMVRPSMDNVENWDQLFTASEKMLPYLGCQNSFLVIDHRYFEDMANVDALMHYSKTMDLAACQNPGGLHITDQKNHVYMTFDRSALLPDVIQKQCGQLIEIYALRQVHTIGYLVTDGLSKLARYNLMELFLHTLVNVIENMRRELLLKQNGERLGSLYVKDQLTGLYNRFGLETEGRKLYHELQRENGEAWICFVDIDDMKHINDTYGHEEGDAAIRDTAEILKRAIASSRTFFMRYGGDEFVIITEHPCSERIEAELAAYRRTAERPFHLSLSTGDYCSQKKDRLIIELGIRRADENMYRIKKEHKQMHVCS